MATGAGDGPLSNKQQQGHQDSLISQRRLYYLTRQGPLTFVGRTRDRGWEWRGPHRGSEEQSPTGPGAAKASNSRLISPSSYCCRYTGVSDATSSLIGSPS